MLGSRFAIVGATAFAWASIVQTQATAPALPAALRGHVQGERFAPVAKVGDLPARVREKLHDLFGGKTLDLAEPGAPFQATDVMVTPPLPWRRLVAAGCSADHCLVYYERGGFTHVYQAVLIRTDGTTARLECGGQVPGGMKDLDTVRNVLLSGRVLPGSRW